MVQDPNFWRRFSVAVHQDEAEKSLEAQSGTSSLKHAYVTTTTPSSPVSPSESHTHLHSGLPAAAHPSTSTSTPTSTRPPSLSFAGLPSPYMFPSQPSSPSTPRHTLPAAPPACATPSRSKRVSRRISGLTRHMNPSTLSFGALTGRPNSQFRFCTTITADAPRSDSWLESQKKKQRHRTWMCWAFWLTLLVVIAGVVVAVLLLKAKGII